MKTLKKILLGIIIFIFVVIVLAMAMTKGIADAARNQLEAIRKGDIAKAYGYTSKGFQANTSLEQFKNFIDNNESFKNNEDVSFSSRETQNNEGVLKGELKTRDGKKTPVSYKLVKEDGEWKIETIKLDFGEGGIRPTATELASEKQTQTETTTQQVNSAAKLYDILISDTARSDGYVEATKSLLSKESPKIYATVQISGAEENTQVTAELIYVENGGKIGPVINPITQKGDIMKAFSFTNTKSTWPTGNYKVKAVLSTGDSKEVNFKVQ